MTRTTGGAYADLIGEAEVTLGAAGVETPRLDAEVLLAAAAGLDRTRLIARLRDPVANDAAARFRDLVTRRRRREPVAYLTGEREFWSLPMEVTPAVLIPRPETELLVEVARELLAGRRAPRVCDAGTGSGCIAVALAREIDDARVLALDASSSALAVARRNARRHAVDDRVSFAGSDWFDAVAPRARFDALLSNPPYLTTEEIRPADRSAVGGRAEIEWEPRRALAAGSDGLESFRRLLGQAPAHLNEGAFVALEIGCGQSAAVRDLAVAAGFGDVDVRDDLAGIPRVVIARGGAR
jgi:release factor glutamine methyltransferase